MNTAALPAKNAAGIARHAPTVLAFLTGLLFSVGLVVSGMTLPKKVVGFLDLFGQWDPSLAFVMIGAIAVHSVLYRLIMKRKTPMFEDTFKIPTRKDIDPRLVAGSALFGAGWGLGGVCPGPGLVGSMSAAAPGLVFVGAMITGMVLFQAWDHGKKH